MEKETLFIAFSTQKGGAGKTTLTVLVASYLHYVKGMNVAVVDCDYPQHSIAEMRKRDLKTVMEDEHYKLMAYRQLQRIRKKAYPIAESTAEDAVAKADELLEKMPPFLTGGEMIDSVTRDGAVYAELPHKFEAGTVNAGGAVALAAAIDYLESVGLENVHAQEQALTRYAYEGMKKIPGVNILGSDDPDKHCGILSFTVDGVHPHDIATILDSCHVDVRAGHHCAQPLLAYLGVRSCARASLAFYNTTADIDRFLAALGGVRKEMGYAE